jgi:hypothetical protein
MYLVGQGAPVSPDFSWAGASEWIEKLIINRRRWSLGAHCRQLSGSSVAMVGSLKS